MPYVPSDIFHAAADGVTILNANERTMDEVPPQNNERSPLIKRANLAKIRTWIERGGDVNGEPEPGLREATAFENNIMPVVYPGTRLLSVAADCGRVDVMRLLLANGADVNYVNRRHVASNPSQLHWNALVHAVFRKRDVAVRLLIENGADVNFAVNNYQYAVLTLAKKSPRILKMLLAAGADPSWRDSEGLTVEYMAFEEYAETSDEVTAISARQASQPWPHLAEAIRQRDGLFETYEILLGARVYGSYKKYVIQTTYPPAKDLLVLRALVCGSRRTKAGRAVAGPETPKAVARLFESCPDGVFWLVIKYWKLGNWYYPLVQEPRRKQPIPSSSPTSYYHSCLKEGWSAEDWSDDDDATTTP